MDYLLNEDSTFCILPETFTQHHIGKLDDNVLISAEEIQKVEMVLEKAKKMNQVFNKETFAQMGTIPKKIEDT